MRTHSQMRLLLFLWSPLVLAALFDAVTVAQHSFLPPTSSVRIHNGFASHSSSVLHQSQPRIGHSLSSNSIGGHFNDEAALRHNFVQ